MKIDIINVPLQNDLAEELIDFWENIFRTPFTSFQSILSGAEMGHNLDILYIAREGGKLAGTCHLTVSRSALILGGLGEVVTAPEFRGRGLASELCKLAWSEFTNCGGRALFLGTQNPAAERIYQGIGWKKLNGTNVMINSSSNCPPEVFYDKYFEKNEHITVVEGNASARIPMIPLIVFPHCSVILDSNIGIISSNFMIQNACMGLYPRYVQLTANGNGIWFEATTAKGCLTGLSTAQLEDTSSCRVDGFIHPLFENVWEELIICSVQWGMDRGAISCYAVIAEDDKYKQNLFKAIGFEKTNERCMPEFYGKGIRSVIMRKM